MRGSLWVLGGLALTAATVLTCKNYDIDVTGLVK